MRLDLEIVGLPVCDWPISLIARNVGKTRLCCCEKPLRVQSILSAYYYYWLMLWRGSIRVNFPLKRPTEDKLQQSWRLVNPGDLGLDFECREMNRTRA